MLTGVVGASRAKVDQLQVAVPNILCQDHPGIVALQVSMHQACPMQVNQALRHSPYVTVDFWGSVPKP